ncbi:kinase-like protein, partial [Rhizophagus irregularis]
MTEKIRQDLVNAAFDKARENAQGYIAIKQIILNNENLRNAEKNEALKFLNEKYDRKNIRSNKGTKRTCEKCEEECSGKSYCENCIRNYLKKNFSNWTSGNKNIDTLIKKCQIDTLSPNRIIEWIPYDKLQNIKYLTKGGFSVIYEAEWINGRYYEWDSKEKKLKRKGTKKVILKTLEDNNNEEAEIHLTMSNKWGSIVRCYGITKDPSKGYMLVENRMDMDLREYLKHEEKITWQEKVKITYQIIKALGKIHKEKAIHKDLHSGNILYSKSRNYWYISDLGLCGPADKSPESVYGNLPYIAPEVITRKEYSYASDIYSIGMLMWEISSGQPPFINYEHNYGLAMDIVAGKRPKITPETGTPLQYKELMERCWDANITERSTTESI